MTGGILSSTPVTLQWKPTQDPDGDTVDYKVVFCEDPEFANCNPIVVSTNQENKPPYATLLALSGSSAGIMLLGFAFPKQRRRYKLLMLAIIVSALLLSCSNAADQAGEKQSPSQLEPSFSYIINSLNSNTIYYWKVISSDKAMSTDSDIWRFSIEK